MSNAQKRIPLNGTFELTGRCNLSCHMCLVRVDHNRMHKLGLQERTADEWIHMAEQIANAGTLSLLLSGGEVMLRQDFVEIYRAIAKMGFVLTVYTNATIVTDDIMKAFHEYPPHKIGVTIYGASNNTYNKLCGCPDGYDRFIYGLHQLSSLPSKMEIRTTIVKENLADIPYMKQFVQQTFGADQVLHISRNVVNKIRGGVACPQKSRLSPKENMNLVFPGLCEYRNKFLLDKNSEEINRRSHLVLKHRTPVSGYLFQNCGAGTLEYAINWAGRMYACELLNQGYTEPFEEGFDKAWERLPEQYPQGHLISECKACEYAGVCEACPAVRMAETGDWFGIPSYVCDEAKYIYQLLSDIKAVE